MIPGINSRQVKMMMRRMGLQQTEIEAREVIIRTPEKEIVIQNPSVSKIDIGGQETYQVVGHAVERDSEVSEEDIETVMEQAKVTKAEAERALKESSGDLAEAILSLRS